MSAEHTLSERRMLQLMAYADGELEGAERAEVEGWLASDIDAVRFANEIAGLGDLVKMGHEGSASAKAVASFDITDAVMAAVKDEKDSTGGDVKEERRAAPVVSLADAARTFEGQAPRAPRENLLRSASLRVVDMRKSLRNT